MRKDPILARRSVRRFTAQDVEEKDVRKLLEAGMSAPSAGNERPWHFLVIRDRRTLEGVMEFHPYAKMLKECAGAILVCGDPSLEKYPGFWMQDCSAATENILIMAVQLNLGAVWLGIYPIDERVNGLRELLGIPEDVVPFSLVPFGHPAEERKLIDRYDGERVHKEKW
jgi:nitroreductase